MINRILLYAVNTGAITWYADYLCLVWIPPYSRLICRIQLGIYPLRYISMYFYPPPTNGP